jgi:hypothetical protein
MVSRGPASMFDHPLVRALIQQRDIAMNNWAVQAMRVAELETEIAMLRKGAAADVAEPAPHSAANGELHEELSP